MRVPLIYYAHALLLLLWSSYVITFIALIQKGHAVGYDTFIQSQIARRTELLRSYAVKIRPQASGGGGATPAGGGLGWEFPGDLARPRIRPPGYRGTSLIRNTPLLGPYSRTYSRTKTRVLWWS